MFAIQSPRPRGLSRQPPGHPRRDLCGQPAQSIAGGADIWRDTPIRLIVMPLDLGELHGPFGGEKLAPILSLVTVNSQQEGLALCKLVLAREGLGYTAFIHTQDPHLAERYGQEVPASRTLTNSPGPQVCCGISTDLMPSATLGRGTAGGSSTSYNVTYTRLGNIQWVAYTL